MLTLHNGSLLDIKKMLKQQENIRLPPVSNKEELTPSQNSSSDDRTLVFESRFESGNLAVAVKESDHEYNLVLQNDVNTKGHTQWFYFSVSNTSQGLEVKFNLVNFSKKDSLFNNGMKVLVFSEAEHNLQGTGWMREGTQINYFLNHYAKPDSEGCYYTLTFTYTFQHTSDTVFFAYSCPYTYSDLMADIKRLEDDAQASQVMSRRLLCETLGGNRCELLTITNKSDPESSKKKKGVFISARVHPGETVASWMMKGVMDFLTGPSVEAHVLREHFIFKLVPMLNPDGVINGNYRCSLLGVDLNRRWLDPHKNLHPTIFASKRLLRNLRKERPVELICDLHGHSRRKNIFMYGCNVPDRPELTRTFPCILSKMSAYFSYPYCSFKMQKSKESTLRIAMFKDIRVPATYTLEASFCGANFGPFAGLHYTLKHLQEMGEQLCRTLIVYCDLQLPQSELASLKKTEIVEEINNNIEVLDTGEDSSSGSDSDPSEDNLDAKKIPELIKITKGKKKPAQPPPPVPVVEVKSSSPPKQILTIPVVTNKREINKCVTCGSIEREGHSCRRKNLALSSSEKPLCYSSVPYYNKNRKRVRDQATQTPKPQLSFKGEDPRYHHASSEPFYPRTRVSSPRYFTDVRNNQRGHVKKFASFGDTQKLIEKPNFPKLGKQIAQNSWRVNNLRRTN